jgi:hypothetical protein
MVSLPIIGQASIVTPVWFRLVRLRLGVVGLGKMGLSHLAMINAHPSVKVVAICDATGYVLDVLNKYTGVKPEWHLL